MFGGRLSLSMFHGKCCYDQAVCDGMLANSLIAISFIAVVCSIVRMVALAVWMRSSDISWNYPLIPFLANMEACVALMTSSVPAIYPLFRRPERREDFSNPPTIKSEAARTELKSMFEEEEGKDFVPGLAPR